MRALFLVLDTVRRDYLESYGNSWVHTPNLKRLAESGVVFDNHWVGSLPCMPARREFMTGRYNFVYRPWGPIEPFDDVLPSELRKHGMFTHLLTDHYHYFELGGGNYHTSFNTWDFQRGQEEDPWVSSVDAAALPDHIGNMGQQNWKNRRKQRAEADYSGPRTILSALEWLHDNRKAEDWFLQVELFDPHEPFDCPDEYLEMYRDDWPGPLFDWPFYGQVTESPEAVAHIQKRYAALLTMTDRWVGKLLDRLRELGLYDDTLIVFTTDHGTMLGEHDFFMKLLMPCYNEIARIPLIVHLPGGERAGTREAALTQTIDLMPTFLDFYGCPEPPHVQGQSLLPLLQGGAGARTSQIFGYFGMATNITDGRYVYFRNPVNADAGPLHAYTAMPTQWVTSWWPREDYARVEMGRYFGHTYNLPQYRFPAAGRIPSAPPGELSMTGRHELFDLEADPAQEHPLQDEALEEALCAQIAAHLQQCEAPVEQYSRLGLTPP